MVLLLSAGLFPTALRAEAADGFLHNGVTAHRGNSDARPENTLPAFRSAVEAGADWVELDIFRTRDGQLVVIHDRTTGRVGDKDLDVTRSTYEELKTVDVATDFRKRHGLTVQQCPAERIPTLEDVLRLVIAQPKTRVSIQPKMDCVDDAVALVKRLVAERWVGFNDGNLAYMKRAKELAPKLPVFWDRGEQVTDEDIRTAKECGFEAIVLRHDLVTKEAVEKIRAAGLEAGAWTVDDEPTMKRLLSLGVERIYTDRPVTLLALKRPHAGFGRAACEGNYPGHLQGICTDDSGALFWSFTTFLLKTDAKGHLLKKIPVASHHGDLCYRDGKLYVAVNLGHFNDPKGNADCWVYVYRADDLAELARHKVAEVVYGAGGIACDGRRFLVVGGLPPGIDENYAYEYDLDLHFVKRHTISSGYTLMGIQTAAYADHTWWFGCYGNPRMLLKTDDSLHLLGKYRFDAAVGIVPLSDGEFLIGTNYRDEKKRHSATVRIARPDKTKGLVPVE